MDTHRRSHRFASRTYFRRYGFDSNRTSLATGVVVAAVGTVAVAAVLGRFHHVHSSSVVVVLPVEVVELVPQPLVLVAVLPEIGVAVACTEVGTAAVAAVGTAAGIAAVAVGTATVVVAVVPLFPLPLDLVVAVLGVDSGIAVAPIVGLAVRHCY